MVAYVAPYLEKAKRDRLAVTSPRRRTFNMTLVAEGWAANCLVWLSLPWRRKDLDQFLSAAGAAWRGRKGNWAGRSKALLLTGYEFRALIKIGRAARDGMPVRGGGTRNATEKDDLAAFERHSVARDGTPHGRFGCVAVPHGDRLWAWSGVQAEELATQLGR